MVSLYGLLLQSSGLSTQDGPSLHEVAHQTLSRLLWAAYSDLR